MFAQFGYDVFADGPVDAGVSAHGSDDVAGNLGECVVAHDVYCGLVLGDYFVERKLEGFERGSELLTAGGRAETAGSVERAEA